MASFWFSASFRIHGAPHLHPEIIATLSPGDECHKKGDAVPDRPGKKWPNDIWLLSSEVPEMQDISDHLRWIVDFGATDPATRYHGWLLDSAFMPYPFSDRISEADWQSGKFRTKQ